MIYRAWAGREAGFCDLDDSAVGALVGFGESLEKGGGYRVAK